ncbi:MAG: cyclase family protein [Planctomycetia bacterium]
MSAWPARVAAGLLASLAAIAVCQTSAPAQKPKSAAPPAVGGRSPAARFAAGTWLDLTHAFDAATIYWPTEKGFEFQPGANGPNPKGYYYAANRFATAEHGGTHLDAPRHFAEGRPTADEIEPSRLVGEAAVIDVRAKCVSNSVYEVTADDLVAWEEAHGRQLVDVIVLLRTGWSSRWGDRAAYLGTDVKGPDAVPLLRFPGLAPDAARWLVGHRRVKAVGIDTASIDHGPSTLFGSHVALCKAGVPIFENLDGLGKLPQEGAFLAALPMKIAGGSGGPLRVLARLPDDD